MVKVSSYKEAEMLFNTFIQKNTKNIILYGRGNNGKTHLMRNVDTRDYKLVFEYTDILELGFINNDKTTDKFIVELHDTEELSYFEDNNSSLKIIDMNSIKM